MRYEYKMENGRWPATGSSAPDMQKFTSVVCLRGDVWADFSLGLITSRQNDVFTATTRLMRSRVIDSWLNQSQNLLLIRLANRHSRAEHWQKTYAVYSPVSQRAIKRMVFFHQEFWHFCNRICILFEWLLNTFSDNHTANVTDFAF